MLSRFDLDFNFCTSFYKIYKPVISFSAQEFMSANNKIIMTFNNKLVQNQHQISYKLIIEFYQNKVEIYSYYRELQATDKEANRYVIERKKTHNNTSLKIYHDSLFTKSLTVTDWMQPDEEFILRLATYLALDRLHHYATSFPALKELYNPLFDSSITDSQEAAVNFLNTPSTTPTLVSASSLLNEKKHEATSRSEDLKKEKHKKCSIS